MVTGYYWPVVILPLVVQSSVTRAKWRSVDGDYSAGYRGSPCGSQPEKQYVKRLPVIMIVQTSSLYSCRIRFLGLREGVMAQCLTLRTPWRWHVAYLITWCPFPSPIHFRCTWDTTVWLVRTPSSAQAESRNTDGQGCEPARAIRWHIARLSLPRSRRRDTASNSPRCQASTTPCQIDSDRRPGRADAPPLTVDGQQSWFQESSAAVIIPLPWWTLSLTTALEDSEGSSLDRSRSLSATRHWLVIVDVVVVVVQAGHCPCRCLWLWW